MSTEKKERKVVKTKSPERKVIVKRTSPNSRKEEGMDNLDKDN